MDLIFINIAIIGFLAGFIFSIPVAGPINIIITSNALCGKLRFCIRTAIGSSIIEFFYIIIIVYGISSLFKIYQPIIPYLIYAGAAILIFVGYRVTRKNLDIENLDDKKIINDHIKNRGGLRTGIFVNLTNPSLFLGWLTSTLIIFSFVSSIGIDLNGLDIMVNENIAVIQELTDEEIQNLENDSSAEKESAENNPVHPLLLSIVYAAALSLGSFVWLYYFSKLVVKYRKKLNVRLLNLTIKTLGYLLILLGIFLIIKVLQL